MTVDLSDPPFVKGTAIRWTTQLRDENDAPLPASSLSSLKLTLLSAYDVTQIVNGVDHVDVLNAGRGAMDSTGHVVILFQPEDMQKVTSLAQEKLLARLDWVYSGSPGSWAIYIGLTD